LNINPTSFLIKKSTFNTEAYNIEANLYASVANLYKVEAEAYSFVTDLYKVEAEAYSFVTD